MFTDPQFAVLVFEVSGQTAALPLEDVERVLPLAQLAQPPGSPSALEGVLNLGGAAVSILRLDRLLGLPPRDPGLYSAIILLKSTTLIKEGGSVGLLVDRMSDLYSVPNGSVVPVRDEDSFNGCALGVLPGHARPIPVLATRRLLLEQESRRLAEFQQAAQQRLPEWEMLAR